MKQAPLFAIIDIASKVLMIRGNQLCAGSMAGVSAIFQPKKGLKIE